MVSSKKILCFICNKKCSGNVLRYQDRYYHKQCFQSEQLNYNNTTTNSNSNNHQQDHAVGDNNDLRLDKESLKGSSIALSNNNKNSSSSDNIMNHISHTNQKDSIINHNNSTINNSQLPPAPVPSSKGRAINHQQHHISGNNIDNNNFDNLQSQQPSSSIRVAGSNRSQQTYFQTGVNYNNNNAYQQSSRDVTDSCFNSTASISRSGNNNIINNNSGMSHPESQAQPHHHNTSHNYNNNNSDDNRLKSQTIDPRRLNNNNQLHQDHHHSPRPAHHPLQTTNNIDRHRSATLPHSISSPSNGFLANNNSNTINSNKITSCAGCGHQIKDGQALIALDFHWHVWCFKCHKCQIALHGEYVAKNGKAYCEKDYQKLFGVICVYCKRYITGKVLQAGEAHHFHPSCARCSKCGDPFIPGEEMYLQGEVTWHPRCGPGPDNLSSNNFNSHPIDDLDASSRPQLQENGNRAKSPSLSSCRSRSRSVSPFSYMSRQYARSGSPYGYTDSEAVGDLSRIYTISYLNSDPAQGYLRRPIEPHPPKSPQFSRPVSSSRDRSRSSSRTQFNSTTRDVPRGMCSVLSAMRSSSSNRARSPSMKNEEPIELAHYPGAQRPSPNAVPNIERDDFPAPPFLYPERNVSTNTKTSRADTNHVNKTQERASRPRSREIPITLDKNKNAKGSGTEEDANSNCSHDSSLEKSDPRFKKEEEELSKIASGIGKIFLQTLKEREKLRAWKRANLDPRNASRTASATRELPSSLRYDNPTNASPSRDLDRPRPWEEDDADHSPTRTRSSLGRPSQMSSSCSYGYKVVQSNRLTPRPGYGVTPGPYSSGASSQRATTPTPSTINTTINQAPKTPIPGYVNNDHRAVKSPTPSHAGRPLYSLHRSMPNVNFQQQQNNIHNPLAEPPKLYPYHLLVTSNYRLPPDVDRCHLERHLSNEEFQWLFNCDRFDFYRLPEWRRNELKRRARLF